MYCPICDQKPMNCDCTEAERRMYSETEDLEIEVERLRAENKRLWEVISDMKAAAETAGLAFRNTDSGPNLVRY
jgi:hypothetical protein